MQPNSVVIVDPTKFLGNLLIALGVIQQACRQFDRQGISYTLVFDECFKPLIQPLFEPGTVLYYPRKALRHAGLLQKLSLYFKFVHSIRAQRCAIALDMEGDSVSSLLTVLCGSRKSVGPHGTLRTSWYKQLSAPKPEGKHSEFYKYRNVLACVTDIPKDALHYGRLKLSPLSPELVSMLNAKTINRFDNLIVLHTGASKVRKHWPTEHWVALIQLLRSKGLNLVMIGAGSKEVDTNQKINNSLESPIPDLSNQLCLQGLSQLVSMSRYYIGNDSGPMHLATALGVPGIALFGPTNDKLWGPLLSSTVALRGHRCPDSCRNGHSCDLKFKCLTALTPDKVFKQVMSHFNSSSKPIQLPTTLASCQPNLKPAKEHLPELLALHPVT